MSKCRDCDEPIRWVITTAGKTMPVDPVPHPEGNVLLTPDGLTCRVLGPLDRLEQRRIHPLYLSHFATCEARDHSPRPRADNPQLTLLEEATS